MKQAVSGLAVVVSASTSVMVSCKAMAANHPLVGRWATAGVYSLSLAGSCTFSRQTYEFNAGGRFQKIVVSRGPRRSGRSTSNWTFEVQGSELTLCKETETWVRIGSGPATYTDKPIGTVDKVRWRIEGQKLIVVDDGAVLTFYRESNE